MQDVYFDNGATTKVDVRVADVIYKAMTESYGNPSSLHSKGLEAERLLKRARATIADKLKAFPEEIVFTSGGSESNNLAILGSTALFRTKGEIITSKVEHKSVLECMKCLEEQGFTVIYLDVDENGVVILDDLKAKLSANTQLVSVMHVNNECGSIQPINDMYKAVKDYNPKILFHTDNVQGFCKVEEPVMCDMMSVSAHKIHGPKGVGALYVKKGIRLSPVIYGGGQERGIRGGTENVPGVLGFAEAVSIFKNESDRLKELKKHIIDRVTKEIPKVFVNADFSSSSSYILNIAMLGLRSEIILHSLEQRGIYVSSGSACSSHKPSPSHVLSAMGFSAARVDSSIRLSFCAGNTVEEADAFCDALLEIANINKKVRRL